MESSNKKKDFDISKFETEMNGLIYDIQMLELFSIEFNNDTDQVIPESNIEKMRGCIKVINKRLDIIKKIINNKCKKSKEG